VREYEALTETAVTVLSDRRRSAPYGARGGKHGVSGRNTIHRAGAAEHEAEPVAGKAWLTLRAGDRLRIETPGGGGWGTPEEPKR
jgi:N-methylhydantoinase B